MFGVNCYLALYMGCVFGKARITEGITWKIVRNLLKMEKKKFFFILDLGNIDTMVVGIKILSVKRKIHHLYSPTCITHNGNT